MSEIWKDIPGYKGYYQVSNLGRVKSLSRIVKNRQGEYLTKEMILNPTKAGNKKRQYYVCNLSKNNKRKLEYIHHLVAISFLNHTINHQTVVDHIDNNPLNNKLENIQIITQKINANKDINKDKISIYYNKCSDKYIVYAYINNKLTRIASSKFKHKIDNIINKLKELQHI